MRQIIKDIVLKLGIEIKRHNPKGLESEVVSLKTKNGSSKGNMLLSYVIEPFLLKPGEPISNAHHHDWLSWQIAQTFLELGYNVDVIHYHNTTFIPKKIYSFFVGARTNFQRIAELLNKDCVKIVHLDTAHWLFNNYASFQRSLDLQRRRGLTITRMSQRIVESNLAIEYADYATTNIGNQFNVGTYSYAKKPIFQTPIPSCAVYPWQEDKNYETCRRNFVWFGSGGLVHKGLDLALEAFVEMPDHYLYVCGPIQQEKDFERIYYKELYKTPNIKTIGWVDVESPKFTEIMNDCVGVVFPSCSEGGGASVIICMQAGLMPIVSYESNVEVGDFGVTLKNCSISEIKNSVLMVSNFSAQELKLRSRKAWEYASNNHTKERYAEEFRKFIEKIISSVNDKPIKKNFEEFKSA